MNMRATAALTGALLLTAGAVPAFAQDSMTAPPVTTVEREESGFDMGWLGLLGLAGLMGLRKKSNDHTTTTSHATR